MNLLVLLSFGDHCPKCRMVNLICLRWCRGCDDCLTEEHLHKTCICTHRRIERCADSPVPAEKPPEPPAPATEAPK